MASDHPKPAPDAGPDHVAQQDGSEVQGQRGQLGRAIAFFDSTAKVLVALGGLIVAAVEVLLIYYVDPLLSDVVPFLVLIAMLIVRPWGLFGTREELDRV